MDTTASTEPAFERASAVVATGTGDDYRVEIRAGKHTVVADEPHSAGGGDTGPTPIGLLLSAVGSCTAITLRMYAQRKGWPLEEVRVRVAFEKGTETNRITRRIDLIGDIDDDQRASLLAVAERTPVTRAVSGGTPIVTQ